MRDNHTLLILLLERRDSRHFGRGGLEERSRRACVRVCAVECVRVRVRLRVLSPRACVKSERSRSANTRPPGGEVHRTNATPPPFSILAENGSLCSHSQI